MIDNGEEYYPSKYYDIGIFDRVGGGLFFLDGLLDGLLSVKRHEEALEFSVAASALKHTISGEFSRARAEDVEHLMNGDASGQVQ